MTLSLENKQGGKLKRWSLTTALWPRDTGARATCERRWNVALGMHSGVCAHALVCVSVIPQLECDCLVPECVPLCVLVSASYKQRWSPACKILKRKKNQIKQNSIHTLTFLSYLCYSAGCQNKCSVFPSQGNAEKVPVNVGLSNWSI